MKYKYLFLAHVHWVGVGDRIHPPAPDIGFRRLSELGILGINVSKFVAETVTDPEILKPGAWYNFWGFEVVLISFYTNPMLYQWE